jgi:hypothetical protein
LETKATTGSRVSSFGLTIVRMNCQRITKQASLLKNVYLPDGELVLGNIFLPLQFIKLNVHNSL